VKQAAPLLENFIRAHERADTVERRGLERQFWQDVKQAGAPLLENNGDGTVDVTFVCEAPTGDDAPESVVIWSWLFDCFNPEQGGMERVGDSGVWHLTAHDVPDDVLVNYRFCLIPPALDRYPPATNIPRTVEPVWNTARPDPYCAEFTQFRPESEGLAWTQSTLRGPNAPAPEVASADHAVFIEEIVVRSDALGGERKLLICLPDIPEAECAGLPLFASFDGINMLRSSKKFGENVLAMQQPMIGVFLVEPESAEDRDAELLDIQALGEFFGTELLPEVERVLGERPDLAHYTFSDDPKRRVIAGGSLGGVAALQIGYEHPDTFGAVIAVSPALWVRDEEFLRRVQEAPPVNNWKVALAWGRYEGRVHRLGQAEPGEADPAFSRGIRDLSRELAQALTSQGLTVHALEHTGGHDNFNRAFSLALEHIHGPVGVASGERSRTERLDESATPPEMLAVAMSVPEDTTPAVLSNDGSGRDIGGRDIGGLRG
jgi:enterochelin esterase-like enzyme